MSSHLLSEVEKICHRVAIIFQGNLLAEDTMENLVSKIGVDKEIMVELDSVPVGIDEELKKLDFIYSVSIDHNNVIVNVPKSGDFRKQLSEFFIKKSLVPLKIQEKLMTLEDAFTTITQDNVEKLAGIGGKS